MPTISRSGDGLIAALKILEIICKSNKTPSSILNKFFPVPQKLENLKNIDKSILRNSEVLKKIKSLQNDIGSNGRILLRPSGTEPLIRVMVESKDKKLINLYIDEIKSILSAFNT